MRKFILVAAMVLVSATAQAGASLASSDHAAAIGQSSAGEAGQSAGRQRPSMRYQGRMRMRQQHGFASRHGHGPRFGLLGKGRGLLARIKFALHRRYYR